MSSELAKKPKSAWLLQFAAAALAASALFGLYRAGMWALTNHIPSWVNFLMDVTWRLFSLAVPVCAIFGTQQRATYGRLSGLALLGFILAFAMYTRVIPKVMSLTEPAQQDGSLGQLISSSVVVCFIGYWFYAFGFSNAAREYFRVRESKQEG